MGGEHEQERTEGVHGSRRACVQMAMGWWLALVIVGDAVLAGGGGRYKSGRGRPGGCSGGGFPRGRKREREANVQNPTLSRVGRLSPSARKQRHRRSKPLWTLPIHNLGFFEEPSSHVSSPQLLPPSASPRAARTALLRPAHHCKGTDDGHASESGDRPIHHCPSECVISRLQVLTTQPIGGSLPPCRCPQALTRAQDNPTRRMRPSRSAACTAT